MAKTVDQFSTLEDFRQKYNELAIDVGDKSGLRTTSSATVIDALNSLEDKSFFFQEFVYTATGSQTVFTGADTFDNTLLLRQNRLQAYKNGVLKLPIEAKFGVYMAYRYYRRLLKKLEAVPSEKIMDTRIRISDPMKINLLARSYVKYKLNMI